MNDIKFAIILVTYNRLNCLQIALKKYDGQTKSPAYILVIDNASSDGTREYLDQWADNASEKYEKIVVHCPENTGGSGGFSRGIEEGIKLDCDFLFLADDDAYAEPDMLEQLENGYNRLKEGCISALCTTVINRGQYEIGHRCYIREGIGRVSLKFVNSSAYIKDSFQVDILTFIGAAIKKEAAIHVGLPKKEYFIWWDDTEYSLRLRKIGDIYCIPSSVMNHNVIYDKMSSWKNYYGIRNWIDMIRNHYSKRYYYSAVVEKYIKHCSFLASLIRKRNKEYRKMSLDAIQDAVNSRLGKNEKYLPGKK